MRRHWIQILSMGVSLCALSLSPSIGILNAHAASDMAIYPQPEQASNLGGGLLELLVTGHNPAHAAAPNSQPAA
eukprot:gene18276-18537_t